MKVQFDINSCKDCKFLKEERYYTADSFENAYNWFCKKRNNKKIAGYVEWNDKVKIPEWCPIKVIDKKK